VWSVAGWTAAVWSVPRLLGVRPLDSPLEAELNDTCAVLTFVGAEVALAGEAWVAVAVGCATGAGARLVDAVTCVAGVAGVAVGWVAGTVGCATGADAWLVDAVTCVAGVAVAVGWVAGVDACVADVGACVAGCAAAAVARPADVVWVAVAGGTACVPDAATWVADGCAVRSVPAFASAREAGPERVECPVTGFPLAAAFESPDPEADGVMRSGAPALCWAGARSPDAGETGPTVPVAVWSETPRLDVEARADP
jgi:hypothetical protein